MPTDRSNRTDDISRPLPSAEAPRSPRELDERIIRHARQKAEQYAEYSSSGGFKWLAEGWKTALVVSSVAAIAISVTIQVYDGSSTIPFVASRAEPESEAADVELRLNELSVQTESQFTTSAEPVQAGAEQERSTRVQASPSATSDVPTQNAVRVAERQALGFTDSRNQQLLNVVEPSLVELLSDIDDLEANTQGNQTINSDVLNNRLRVVLDVLESSFGEVSTSSEPAGSLDTPPTIEQLLAKASVLINTYHSIDNDQSLLQIQSAYERQLENNRGTGLPQNLMVTIEVLDNWLSGR